MITCLTDHLQRRVGLHLSLTLHLISSYSLVNSNSWKHTPRTNKSYRIKPCMPNLFWENKSALFHCGLQMGELCCYNGIIYANFLIFEPSFIRSSKRITCSFGRTGACRCDPMEDAAGVADPQLNLAMLYAQIAHKNACTAHINAKITLNDAQIAHNNVRINAMRFSCR